MRVSLVIFDYSGTLSLGSVLFARPENLAGELARSGLAALGIVTPGTFWDEVVNPTWQEGSLTPAGYREIVSRRVQEISGRERAAVHPAASRFADAYFSRSRIDPGWQPILKELSLKPSVKVIIATDHYAEATDVIMGALAEMQIPASSLRDALRRVPDEPFVVANSADVGHHKAQRRFWEKVKDRICPDKAGSVLIVDDFGSNEQAGDSYAGAEKVAKRQRETVAVLEDVFGVDVEPVHFALREKDRGIEEAGRIPCDMIEKARTAISRHLARGRG